MIAEKIALFITLATVLGVAFVNGWTDAPNAIASAVSSRSLSMKNAVIIASVADLSGSLLIGVLNGRVTDTIIGMASFGSNPRIAVLSLCACMFSVILWAVTAWKFGIPTSESHALIAAISGASVAVNHGFSGINPEEWMKILWGLFVSLFLGFVSGFLISGLTINIFRRFNKNRTDKFFRISQILSCILMAFMHGAQDAQKFTGIAFLALSSSDTCIDDDRSVVLLIIVSLVISIGTASGGGRIIKSVGMDIIRLRKDQGFSADLAGALCLMFSTLCGMPVSTTHTKTSAVIGVGAYEGVMKVNWKKALEMITAWIITLPICFLLGMVFTCLFVFVFGRGL